MKGPMIRPRAAIALAGVLGLGLAMTGPARAADDGYANVFTSLFTALGVVRADPPPIISYRERAPLVLPPQQGLQKPNEGPRRDASWPQDPDVLRHRREVEEARAPVFGTGDHAELLSPGEIAQGRVQGEAVQPNNCRPDNNSRQCLLVNPDELKAMGERAAASNTDAGDKMVAGKEPDRVYLTQPPKGYMKPTKVLKATNEGPHRVVDESNPLYFLTPHKAEEE